MEDDLDRPGADVMTMFRVYLQIDQGGIPYAQRLPTARAVGRLLCSNPYIMNADKMNWCDPHMVPQRLVEARKRHPLEETIVQCDLYAYFKARVPLAGPALRAFFFAPYGGATLIRQMIEEQTPETNGCVVHSVGELIAANRGRSAATFEAEYGYTARWTEENAQSAEAQIVDKRRAKKEPPEPEWYFLPRWRGPQGT